MPGISVRDELKKIFINQFGFEKEDLNNPALDSMLIQGADGLELDSLERAELLIQCESVFHIIIKEDDEEMIQMRTFGELVSYLEKRCAESSPTLVTQPA